MIPFQIFDALLEPCFVLNKDLKVVYCNETAAAVCGLTVRKVQRATFPELFTFSEPPEWLQNISAVTEAAPYKEVLFKTSEGGEGKVQITCQPVAGDEPAWLVFVRDVTLEERLQKKYRGELEQKEGYILELQKAQAELEKYSKNLEKMVEERTAEIRKLNTLMTALLDSLGQGFFAFDRDGLCHDFSSKACDTVLEGRPNGRPVWDVLKLPPNKVEGFKKWLFTLFADMLPFEDLAPLGPPSFPHGEGRHIKLEYFPLTGEAGMEGVVVVASDITNLVEAQREAETEREHARLILNLLNKKQQLARFVRETQSFLRDLEANLAVDPGAWSVDAIFRALHTIKGGAATYNVAATAKAAHEAENMLSAFKESPMPDHADALLARSREVRASFDGFLEETQRLLGPSAFSEERFVEMPLSELQVLCSRLEHWTKGGDLARNLKAKYVFEPVARTFEAFNEVLGKVAESEGKKVDPLILKGGELAVFPDVYAGLFSTFVHAFRNAVDHGIETPAVRLERGKPEAGRIEVSFARDGGRFRIIVTDDGHGIDPAKIRARLAKNGRDASGESDEQVIQHVFDSSFSTRDMVTETSGRGVGMDAIRSAAEELGGTCVVRSETGRGTVLTVDVPWLEEMPSSLKRVA